MLAGHDMIAKAPTGTGKTVAFGIPILSKVDPASLKPQAVILSPTRELAQQIAQDLHGGRGVGLAHARAADDDLLALQCAAVVLDPGVVLFGHVLQPCAQLVDFVGHSAHNANNHGQTSVKR